MPSAQNVTLFTGIENVDDQFLATMAEMDSDISSQISITHPLWQYLEKKNRIERVSDISHSIDVPLLHVENSTVKSMTHYDKVENVPQDALKSASFAYGQSVGVQMYSREELVKNSGKSKMIDLVTTKTDQLKTSMNNHFNGLLMGAQDHNGRDFMGIGRIMTPGASCGGITPTGGFSYWNPQVGEKAPGTQWDLSNEFRKGIRTLIRDCAYQGESPDVIVCGEDVWEAALDYYEDKIRNTIAQSDQMEANSLMMTAPTGETFIYDKALPAKSAWVLNTNNGVKARIHKGSDFTFTPWQDMEGSVSRKRNLLLYAGIYCRRRNLNGAITFA